MKLYHSDAKERKCDSETVLETVSSVESLLFEKDARAQYHIHISLVQHCIFGIICQLNV